MFKIKNLKASIEDKQILKGIDLELEKGKVHVIMGPNGSGKSTLAQVLMGNPSYEVDEGSVSLDSKIFGEFEDDYLELEPNERSLAGIFLSFQYPSEIPGVSIANYLRLIYNKHKQIAFEAEQSAKGTDSEEKYRPLSPVRFRKVLKEYLDILEIPEEFMDRYLNEGFSGGEKKRMEILQMLVTSPKLAILDETDSGLDVDALKVVSKGVNKLLKETDLTVLLITHYTRILKYIEPDYVHILQDGKIVKSGGKDLAHELEEKGYAPFGE